MLHFYLERSKSKIEDAKIAKIPKSFLTVYPPHVVLFTSTDRRVPIPERGIWLLFLALQIFLYHKLLLLDLIKNVEHILKLMSDGQGLLLRDALHISAI